MTTRDLYQIVDDPQGIARDLETPVHIGHWGNGDYEIELADSKNIEYIMTLVKQSYDVNQ